MIFWVELLPVMLGYPPHQKWIKWKTRGLDRVYLYGWDSLINCYDEVVWVRVSIPCHLGPGSFSSSLWWWWFSSLLRLRWSTCQPCLWWSMVMILVAMIMMISPVDHVDRINSCSRTGKCAGTWPKHLRVLAWPVLCGSGVIIWGISVLPVLHLKCKFL